MKELLVLLAIWLLPVILSVQLAKQYKLTWITSDDYMMMFIPLINWLILMRVISEAIEVFVKESDK